MRRLLKTVSVRQARLQRGRTALLLGAVATGVALIVAVGVINTSVLTSFERTFVSLAGPADLEITLGNGEVGFDEAVVTTAARDPDVATAVPFVRGTVAFADEPAEALQLFGAELNDEENLVRYGVHLATARRAAVAAMEDLASVLVTESVAGRLGLHVGSKVRLATARGIDAFTVRGLLAPEGLAAALAGQLIVMDLAAAQVQLAKDARVDQVDLTLRPGADASAVTRRLAGMLGPGFVVAPPAARGMRYADILRGLQTTLTGMSLMCMVAGLFVIHNATSASVVHRFPAIVTLRVLGANGSMLFRLVLVETLILGTFGALLGAGIGILLARLLLALVGETLGIMVQLRFVVPEVSVDWHAALFAVGLGIVATVVAAWLPARRAMRLDPLVVMHGETERAPRLTLLLAMWALLAAIAVATILVGTRGHDGARITVGSFLWYLSAGIIGVPVVVMARRWLLRALPALSGLEGRIAAESLTRVPVRAGMTVAAIGYVVAIGVTLAAVIESYVFTAREFVAAVHDGDLVVSAVATEGGWLEAPVDVQIATAIARVDGVARVEPARVVPGHHYGTGRVGLLALEPTALARFSPALWRAGDLDGARPLLAAGTAVAVSTVFADWYGLGVGDQVTLEAPSGQLTLPIVGVVTDMTSSSGAILMSRRLYADAWHDPTASRFNVFLAPGVGAEEAAARITAALGDRHHLKINALAEALAYIDGKVRTAFGFSRSLQLLIVIVAVAGIFDLLFARIFERRRELALWRVVGAAESAVRRSLVVESLTLGVMASLVGVPLGVATAWLWVRHILPGLVGYDIDLLVPVLSCLGTVALVLVATLAAGRAAAASATRISILDGMRND